jgi:hypothetical protein
MRKHMFGVTCPDAHFVQSISFPPENEKLCIDVLCPGRNGMHYVTRRSHQMQKHKFSVMCPEALFVEFVLVPPEHKK